MKTRTKAALTVLCALLLVVATFLGTLAYMTSHTAVVKNTFTSGNVTITMTESKTDEYGKVVEGADRVVENSLRLIPNHTYVKDPTIYVGSTSEDCYVFVKVTNEIASLETSATIAEQMETNGWQKIEDTDFYYKADAVSANATVPVFTELKIANDADVSSGNGKSISLVAYAIQKDGFNTALEAWDASDFENLNVEEA